MHSWVAKKRPIEDHMCSSSERHYNTSDSIPQKFIITTSYYRRATLKGPATVPLESRSCLSKTLFLPGISPKFFHKKLHSQLRTTEVQKSTKHLKCLCQSSIHGQVLCRIMPQVHGAGLCLQANGHPLEKTASKWYV